MLKIIPIAVSLLLATNAALANPTSESPNLNVTSLDKILKTEEGFTATSTAWSPDGQHLLVTYSKSDSPSNYIAKHYLLDTNSHTFGEISYGTNGPDANGILDAKWTPSGDKIYFGVSKVDPINSGHCFIICSPDGTNLRCIGTNYTDLSSILDNLGDIGFQRNLNWNQDSSKIVFEWEKPENHSTEVYNVDGNGTSVREITSATYPQPVFYDSDKVFVLTNEGTVELMDESGDIAQRFRPENKDEQYCVFSLSPDRKKIIFASGLPGNFDLQTYISNTDGSELRGNISYYDGTDEHILTKEYWQPNGSLLLVNQDGSLYIIQGDESDKRLLYEGDASKPQWFPDGKKILFVENKNKLYSIDVDGSNLTFITNFGLTSSYFWDLLWDPLDKAKQFSVSPSGDLIAFTSALYPDTGEIIQNEPGPSKCQNIAAPVFIVNSDGSNLTKVTPSVKGRHDVLREWSPNGRQFAIGSVLFSRDGDWYYKESSLVELDSENSSSVWKDMPVKEILGSKGPAIIDKIQSNESNSTNTLNATEHKETKMRFPYFMFLLV